LCQKNQGKFVLCGLRDKIFNVIRLLGMADHLSISPSQDEAKTLVSR
jgi:anti-anti-sigma regulatory factor